MKFLFLFLIAISLTDYNYAQKKDNAFLSVHYSFSYIPDTTQRSKVYKEEMVLFIGKDLSVFKSYDKMVNDTALSRVMNSSLKTGSIDLRNHKKTSNVEIYKNWFSNRMLIKEKLINNYLIEDTIPKIKWDIVPETKLIADIKCQKAIGKFKGRIYEVWFSAQIPYNNGPWKLGGLPGLILEASDSKREVIFTFNGMQQLENSSVIVELPKDGIKTSVLQYEKIKKAFRRDPIGFINSSSPSNGITTRIQGNPIIAPKKTINNPIELPSDTP